MEFMRLKAQNGSKYLSYKDLYPVVHLTKIFAIISIHGFEKKIILSTGKYPKSMQLKNDPVFELVTVTDNPASPVENNVTVTQNEGEFSDRSVTVTKNDNEVTVTLNETDVTVTENADLPAKRGRGRPSTGHALTSAQRQAAYRLRQKEKNVTVTISRDDVLMLSTLLNAAKYYGPRTGVEVDQASVQRLIAALDDACGGRVL